MPTEWQIAFGIGGLVLSILGLIHVYARHRDNRLSRTLDRKDEEVEKKLGAQAEKFGEMLETHDQKNTEDFEKVHKEIADVKASVEKARQESKDENKALTQKVDAIAHSLAEIKGARKEKADIMALEAIKKRK